MNRDQISAAARQKLSKAIIALRRFDKFEAVCTTQLTVVEDWSAKTGWTDGVHLGYNPEWLLSRSLEQIRTFLAHENDHVRSGHPWRMRAVPSYLWRYTNSAGDEQINLRLTRRGFIPFAEGWLCDSEFEFMAMEAIAWELWKMDQEPTPEPEPQGGERCEDGEPDDTEDEGPSEGGGGESGDDESNEDEDEGSDDPRGSGDEEDEDSTEGGRCESEDIGDELSDLDCRPFPTEGVGRDAEREAERGFQEYRKNLANAVRYAEANGGMDEGLLREVGEILDPSVPYEEILRDLVDEVIPEDFSWSRPQRDYYQRGIYCPSLYSEKLREIFYFVDTSGSMNERAFDQASGDVLELCEALGAKLRVFYIDNAIRGVQEFDPGSEADDMEPRGGGGTDFRPGFDAVEIEGEDPVAIIYLTDLMCNSAKWPEEPEIPTFFVKWGAWDHELAQRRGMLPEWPVIIEMEEEHWKEER